MYASRFVLSLTLLFALAACGGGGGGDPSGGGDVGGGGGGSCTLSMTSAELGLASDVLTLVNAERAAVGLGPLTWAPCAAETAYQHSLDMDARSFFDHVNPSGMDPGQRLTADGIGYSTYGENIYWSMPTASAAGAMTGWMTSPPHRANILSPAFTHIGIGVHDLGGGEGWWTQVFYTP